LLNFLNVTLRNFLSVGNVTQSVRLDMNGLTLVLGNNTDVGNTGAANSRNGCGKTSLLQAISYGLFGEPLTNIKMDNLINSINQKGMLVTIEFEANGTQYRIERGRKPNILKFYKNNSEIKEENDALGENKHTQDAINDLIGMDHTLFTHIVAMNTYTIPFLKMKPADQREVIEQLLGVVTLSDRDKTLVKQIQVSKKFIDAEQVRIKTVSDGNQTIQMAINKATNDSISWGVAQSQVMRKLVEQISVFSEIDFDAELARFDEIEMFNEEYLSLSASVNDEQRETNELRKELRRLIASKDETEQNLSRASNDQIDRYRAECVRYSKEAEKGCDDEVAKLTAEIARCEREAAKTCDTEVSRITTQMERRREDGRRKLASAEAKKADLAALMAEMENSDGHTCSTCGQGIEGTDHLDKILMKLAVKAEALEAAIEKDVSEAVLMEKEADDMLAEIEKVRANHASIQENWLAEAEKIKDKIEDVKKNQESVRDGWLVKVEEIQTEIALLEKELANKKTELEAIIADLDEQIALLCGVIGERDESENELVIALAEMMTSKPHPITYASRELVWKAREQHGGLQKDLEREQTKENPHENNIASLTSTLQEISYDALNAAVDDLKHEEFIHKLLTSKDSFIRKKIVDRNLYLLNSKLNRYLTCLGLPHEVKFKPDLTVEITHMGRDFDFEQLSRGEMNRVILAVSWSFRDIWEDLNCQINLIFCDEIIDSGLDEAGSEAALEVLSKMSHRKKNVFLVSHKENLIGKVDHILMVHKEEKFTRFELDAAA
jgi:DNA repair exonuclease SbcCD ATPase subunit